MCKYPEQKLKKEWVQNGVKNDAIEWAKSFGEFLQEKDKTKPLSTSQIRKFFGELKRIQASPEKYKDEVPMLKAKLAYAVGRDIKKGSIQSKIKEFHQEFEKGINSIRFDKNYKNDLTNFIKIVESVVAYHKYYGGE